MNNPDELLNQRRLYQNASLCGGTFALLYNPFQLPKMTMACHSSLRISDLQRVLPNTGWFFYPLRMCVRAVDVSVYEWAKIVTWFFFYVVCFEGHLNRSNARSTFQMTQNHPPQPFFLKFNYFCHNYVLEEVRSFLELIRLKLVMFLTAKRMPDRF